MKPAKLIKPVEFITLTAFIMLLTALGIDIILPAFDEIRASFNLEPDSAVTAQIVTFFFIGQIARIIFGSLSDRYGRLAILRAGFALYIGGSFAAAAAQNINWMLAARFVAGMGAGALTVVAVASVRDRFVGDKMARVMSLAQTIFLFVPIIAPSIGAAILSIAPWRVVFLTPALLAIIVFVWSFRLDESLPPERRLALNWSSLSISARRIVGNRVFVRYTTITVILFAPFSSYIASSERMIGEMYGRPELFTWIFSGIGIVMAIFTFLNAQLVGRFGARRIMQRLLTVYSITAGALLVITLASQGMPNIYLFFAFIALLHGLHVAVGPNSDALALESLGSAAGMAAAIGGTAFFAIGPILGSLIDRLLIDTVTPLAVGYLVVGLITVTLVYSARVGVESAVVNALGSEGDTA